MQIIDSVHCAATLKVQRRFKLPFFFLFLSFWAILQMTTTVNKRNMELTVSTLDVMVEAELGYKLVLGNSTCSGKLVPNNRTLCEKAPIFPWQWEVIPNGYPAEAEPITKTRCPTPPNQ